MRADRVASLRGLRGNASTHHDILMRLAPTYSEINAWGRNEFPLSFPNMESGFPNMEA